MELIWYGLVFRLAGCTDDNCSMHEKVDSVFIMFRLLLLVDQLLSLIAGQPVGSYHQLAGFLESSGADFRLSAR